MSADRDAANRLEFPSADEHPHFVRRRELIDRLHSALPWRRRRAHRELLALEARFDRWWKTGKA